MGVLPLQHLPGDTARSLGLTGRESFDIGGLASGLAPRQRVRVNVRDGETARSFEAICRLDGPIEVDYYQQGGILPAVLRRLAGA
jgi:aconitate hydratase